MLNLDSTSVVCVDTVNAERALKSLDVSCANIKFKECILFTHLHDFDILPFKNILDQIKIIYVQKMDKIGYSEFIIKELYKYVTGDHCLIVQHDGYVIDHLMWRDEFLTVDYIGAPWPPEWGFKNRVGNGGFSLRSKRFMEHSVQILGDFDFRSNYTLRDRPYLLNEDYLITNCCYERLSELGMRFADVELASWFSNVYPVPEMKDRTFGVHDIWFQ